MHSFICPYCWSFLCKHTFNNSNLKLKPMLQIHLQNEMNSEQNFQRKEVSCTHPPSTGFPCNPDHFFSPSDVQFWRVLLYINLYIIKNRYISFSLPCVSKQLLSQINEKQSLPRPVFWPLGRICNRVFALILFHKPIKLSWGVTELSRAVC